MLEIYDLDQGDVNEDCACSPGEEMTVACALTDLPSRYYSPGGDDCSCYRNCLEVRYSCEDTNNCYVIRYAVTCTLTITTISAMMAGHG